MPKYVYACTADPTHARREVKLTRMEAEEIPVACSCGSNMHRVPQPFRWGRSSSDVLFDYMDGKYREYRARKARKRV